MKHSVLSLLRAGALYEAEKEYKRLGLEAVVDDEDTIALGGRILKSRALEQTGVLRSELALKSAEKYNQAFRATGGTYSGINTATMYVLAGDMEAAKAIAHTVLEKTRRYDPRPGEDAYYHMATVAEAHLILGDLKMAKAALRDAIDLDPRNYVAHATTVRQFEMLMTGVGAEYLIPCHDRDHNEPYDHHWIDTYRPPKTIHFAGHMFDAREGSVGDRGDIEEAVDVFLHENRIGFAYGCLAAGSDIIIAEKILSAGAELHVVLPCPNAFFVETSVVPFGDEWLDRFYACLAAAKTVRYTSYDEELPDDLTISFASEVAMGLAVLKSECLATSVMQLLIWDGKDGNGVVGTSRDAQLWSERPNNEQIIIPFPLDRKHKHKALKLAPTDKETATAGVSSDPFSASPPDTGTSSDEEAASNKGALSNVGPSTPAAEAPIEISLKGVKERPISIAGNAGRISAAKDRRGRAMRAMLFTDVRGFSGLMDSEIPLFTDHVLKPLAEVCRAEGQSIDFLNTWGDGLFITFDRVVDAARVALKLQKTFQSIDFEAVGLPDDLAIRIGGHYGPVHELTDPFSGELGVFGAQVTVAAKIEPVTAPGSIYVSEPFASALAVHASNDYVAEKMQNSITLHKSPKAVPLFNLRAKGHAGFLN